MSWSSQESCSPTKSDTQSQSQGSQPLEANDGYSTPKKYRNKKIDALIFNGTKSPALRIPASPMMQRLGYGTGVGVYLMERSPKPSGEIRSPWAIKKITKIRESRVVISRRLEYEAEILRHLKHPNIIGYRAFGNPSIDGVFLAMETASKSLADLIEERADELVTMPLEMLPFPARNMEKVAIDTAKALDYLHNEKKLIHGDLKSANVLIFRDFEIAKLCDFGVSRKIAKDGTIEGRYVGTEIWNPMEVILENKGRKKFPVTAKSDIYPYALTLHEMITLKPPHFNTAEDTYIGSGEDATNTNESDSAFDEQAFDAALAEQLGKRPALPDIEFGDSYNLILGVFYCCTEEDPTKRPSAKDLKAMLEPINPDSLKTSVTVTENE